MADLQVLQSRQQITESDGGSRINMHQNLSPILQIVNWLLLCLTILVVLVRILVRVKISRIWDMKIDDALILVSLVFGIAQFATVSVQCANGFGQHLASLTGNHIANALKSQYASQMLYILSICFAKLSIAIFMKIITPVMSHMYMVWTFMAFLGLWSFASLLAASLQCYDMQPWNYLVYHCYDRVRFWIVFASINLITDIFLIAFPIFIIFPIQMPMRKRIVMNAYFFVRVIVVAAVCVQLHYLTIDHSSQPTPPPSTYRDPTFSTWRTIIVTQAVLAASIIATCIPQLRPFLTSLESGLIRVDDLRRHGQQGAYGYNGPTPSASVAAAAAEGKGVVVVSPKRRWFGLGSYSRSAHKISEVDAKNSTNKTTLSGKFLIDRGTGVGGLFSGWGGGGNKSTINNQTNQTTLSGKFLIDRGPAMLVPAPSLKSKEDDLESQTVQKRYMSFHDTGTAGKKHVPHPYVRLDDEKTDYSKQQEAKKYDSTRPPQRIERASRVRDSNLPVQPSPQLTSSKILPMNRPAAMSSRREMLRPPPISTNVGSNKVPVRFSNVGTKPHPSAQGQVVHRDFTQPGPRAKAIPPSSSVYSVPNHNSVINNNNSNALSEQHLQVKEVERKTSDATIVADRTSSIYTERELLTPPPVPPKTPPVPPTAKQIKVFTDVSVTKSPDDVVHTWI